MTTLTTTGTHFELRKVTSNIGAEVQGIDLSEELDGDTVAALRLAGLAAGGDPAEVRRKNLLPKFTEPHTTAFGAKYDSGDYVTALEKALAGFGPRSRASSGSRPLVIEARIDPAQYEAQF